MTGELLTLGLIVIVTIVSIRQHCCLSVGEAEWQVRPEEAHGVISGVPLAGQAVTVSQSSRRLCLPRPLQPFLGAIFIKLPGKLVETQIWRPRPAIQ